MATPAREGSSTSAGAASTTSRRRSTLDVVPREDASSLVFLFAGACAITIAATRAYLVLTGYPQVGGKVYHIAHALWGGLLLTIACLLAVALHDRWVPWVVSALGGAGAGLFVDEVGKFITKKNDYFFPLAASIVYLFLVLLALTTVALSRYSRTSPRAHLHAATEMLGDLADGRITRSRFERLVTHLDAAAEHDPDATQERLITALRGMTRGLQADAEPEIGRFTRLTQGINTTLLRRVTRALLLLHAVAGVLTLLLIPSALFLDVKVLPEEISGVKLGSLAASMYLASTAVSVVGGILSLIAYRAMSPKHQNVERAFRHGSIAMVLMLAVANSLGAYTSQFEILLEAALQAIALLTLNLWARAERAKQEATRPIETAHPADNAVNAEGAPSA